MLWYHTWVLADDKQGDIMAHFYIGCAVWGYKDWVGELFPPASKSGDSSACTAAGSQPPKATRASTQQIYFTFRYYLDAA
jgi:hypothetical protein